MIFKLLKQNFVLLNKVYIIYLFQSYHKEFLYL